MCRFGEKRKNRSMVTTVHNAVQNWGQSEWKKVKEICAIAKSEDNEVDQRDMGAS